MTYSIIGVENSGRLNTLLRGLSKPQAIVRAYRLSRNPANGQIFVEWYRSTDGQHGYLNPSGDHAITGNAWK